MKILEVTGYGNKDKHLIPLKNIINIQFEGRFTSITLSGGFKVNVLESESTIKEMLEYFESETISESRLEDFWLVSKNDSFGEYEIEELPF